MSLGEDAKKFWAMLDEEEIKEVSQAMAALGVVPSVVVEALVHRVRAEAVRRRLDHGLARSDPAHADGVPAEGKGRRA